MKTVRGFRKIDERNKILGLEFFDLILLILLYLIVFLFSKNLFVNLGILMSAYLTLSLYKQGKPPHWTGSLIRFLTIPRSFPLRFEHEKEIFCEK